MQLSNLSSADSITLRSLPTGAGDGSTPLTPKVAREFESVFLAMVLKELRQTASGEGLFPGDNSDTLGGLFDMQLAGHLSEHGGFGLAEMLSRYVSHSTPSPGADE
ncbi:MAG: rod-binding protein [Planctomycetaceae bacterium]